jgi:protoporphyrinogen oxidase
MNDKFDLVVVGAGFTGLTAGLEAARAGQAVLVLERDNGPGGLAGTFDFRDGVTIEKFYHHWFTNDVYVTELVKELGMEGEIVTRPSKTGMYFNTRHWRLATPLDLLRFKPLSLVDRIRLGLLVFKVRQVRNWKSIEHLSIREWLEPLCGRNVFRIIWQPLIENKFSVFADTINAVWMWKKLVLRGNSRDAKGGEQLSYFKGGFGRLAQAMADEIVRLGGEVRYASPVTGLAIDHGRIGGLTTPAGSVEGRQYLFTPAFPVIADLFEGHANGAWLGQLRRVQYLGNACLVLQLDRRLSETYWLNVNDPDFPFVGVIEHTNFDSPDNYGGKHIVFLSRYLASDDPMWNTPDDEYLEFALVHLQRMFPKLERSWICDFAIWRADYAQPVTERGYSDYVPGRETPFSNALICTMAQIYPEDRGTNYAIREGRATAMHLRNLDG